MDFLRFREHVVQVYLEKYRTPSCSGGRHKSSKPLLSRVLTEKRYNRTDHCIVPVHTQN